MTISLRRASFLLLSSLAVLALLLAPVRPVHAQDVLAITVEQFGVGNHYRPGEFVGIQITIDAPIDDLQQAWVQWEMANVDGDVAEYGRPIPLQPGLAATTWLYAPLPPSIDGSETWPVRIFELRDNIRRAEIGGGRISASRVGNAGGPAQLLMPDQSMIGIVGALDVGLAGYTVGGVGMSGGARPPHMHELTRLNRGMTPSDLPDRWEGLKAFEALVWGDAPPSDLTLDQAEALREYIQRGGHLILTLPAATNPWGLGSREGRTELSDLLPHQAPRIEPEVLLSELLPVLAKARGVKRDPPLQIRVFADLSGDFNAIDNEYEPLITMPDGRVIAIRRSFGHGFITVIGVDLASQQLASIPLSNNVANGVPQADSFWNRVLGRRSDTPTASELAEIGTLRRLNRSSQNEVAISRGSVVTQQIAMSKQATIGITLAFFLFLAYFVIAGPGSFYLLKFRGWSAHAWIAFALTAGVFTAIAWGTVSVIREREVAIKHLTVLDHIYRPRGHLADNDPQLQRAVSWFTLQIPGYAKASVTIDNEQKRRDLLATFDPPGETQSHFPNPDRYRVDVGEPPAQYTQYAGGALNDYRLPARSTATMLYAHWMGGLEAEWGGFIQELERDPVQIVRQNNREEGLTGTLTHSLPGTLRDVQLIWVQNQRSPRRAYAMAEGKEQPFVRIDQSGDLLNTGMMVAPRTNWDSGARIDLSNLFPALGGDVAPGQQRPTRLETNIAQRFELRSLANAIGLGASDQLTERERIRRLQMLSLFNQLAPPEYLLVAKDASAETSLHAGRDVGRELDLSVWLTRPCLIIMGVLDNTDTPIPLRVNGEKPPSEAGSITLVRWIYPLPLDTALAFPPPRGSGSTSGGTASDNINDDDAIRNDE